MKFVDEECEIKTTETKNTIKRFLIAEQLLNNRYCSRSMRYLDLNN